MNMSSASPRWIFSALGILGLAVALTAVSPVNAQNETEVKAATTSNTADLPPLPLSPIEKAQRDGTAVPLSLKDITKLALQNNLDIAIQDTNERTSREKLKQVYGDYDPSLTLRLGAQRDKSAVTSMTESSSAGYNQGNSANWDVSFRQPVKTGGTFNFEWNSGRSESNSFSQAFNPRYSASTKLSFTQPLMKNFRIDNTRTNIKLTNLDLKTSDSQFKQKVTDTVSNIQSKYWDLVNAIQDYDIKRQSVRLAHITLRDNRKKVEVGTLAPIGITEAEASLATRELNLINSEEAIIRQENELRQLISSDRKSEIWSQVIVPTDQPDFKKFEVELESAMTTALAKRPEMEQSNISLDRIAVQRKLTENNRKWQFDLTGSFGSSGVAGPYAERVDAYGHISRIPSDLVGAVGTAYKNVLQGGYHTWNVSFNVQVPLRHRSSDAQLAQSEIDRQKALMNRRQYEQKIQVDVRNAIQRIETARKQVETSKMSRQLSQEQLDGEQKRFQAGLSENFRVLERQDQLAQAQARELEALISYKKSILTLQQAMYTLLESNDFEVAKGSSTNIAPLK